MHLNKAVTHYRIICGMSEYKLATASCLDRGALNTSLKNDDWDPQLSTLIKLCRTLNMPVTELITKAQDLSIKEQCAEFGITLGEER
jgi:DNA-binding XRE family transcriptional regulator